MSFAPIESSIQDAQPVYNYIFQLGSTVWRYVQGDEDIWIYGQLYKAIPISDDGIKQSGQAVTDALTLNVPATIGPAMIFLKTPPSQRVLVTIGHRHRNDPDGEAVVVYVGEIAQVNFPMPGQARIICEALSASMKRDGLRHGWQRTCPYALYDPLTCKVDKTLHAVDVRVLAIDGFLITIDTVDGKDDGYFAGGFIEWQDTVSGTEFRGVEEQEGEQLRIFGMTGDLYVGQVMILYPGCDRTFNTCIEKFNNRLNNGGIPNFPGVSPFDGNPVF